MTESCGHTEEEHERANQNVEHLAALGTMLELPLLRVPAQYRPALRVILYFEIALARPEWTMAVLQQSAAPVLDDARKSGMVGVIVEAAMKLFPVEMRYPHPDDLTD